MSQIEAWTDGLWCVGEGVEERRLDAVEAASWSSVGRGP